MDLPYFGVWWFFWGCCVHIFCCVLFCSLIFTNVWIYCRSKKLFEKWVFVLGVGKTWHRPKRIKDDNFGTHPLANHNHTKIVIFKSQLNATWMKIVIFKSQLNSTWMKIVICKSQSHTRNHNYSSIEFLNHNCYFQITITNIKSH